MDGNLRHDLGSPEVSAIVLKDGTRHHLDLGRATDSQRRPRLNATGAQMRDLTDTGADKV